MTIYDQKTGEVVKRDNYALLSDNDLIALSEHILDNTLTMLANDPALGSAVDERSKVRAVEEVLVTQLRGRDVQLEVANNIVEARLRLECRLGATIPRGQSEGWLAKPGSNQYTRMSGDTTTSLNDYQITRDQSSVWQKFAKHEALLADYALTCKEDARPMSGEGFLRFCKTGRHKPKTNRAGDEYEPQGHDLCQTPPEALDPLLPYLRPEWTIWEPAKGEGYLVEAMDDSGLAVVSGDIQTGQNFFDYEPDRWECLVTNPPFSIKYKWLDRCYELGKPFALLLPVETLGAKTAQKHFREYGVQMIFMDGRVDFKMPIMGWDGTGAQFPTAWFTFGLDLPQDMIFSEYE